MDRCDGGEAGGDEPRPYINIWTGGMGGKRAGMNLAPTGYYGLFHFSSATHHGDEAAAEAKQLDHYYRLAGFLSCEEGKGDQCQ
jgi:hypothetical protein